ncbi:hypothetical protein Cgig2_015446 [Carnegiea gigantea]|uniref:Uncharacterized protein n=1 Tax=Carnegiea gigantea TaxID=171969 RepID=A0A9Q1Q958_9CARY|nr:hypothetical protein Cgig2_015446 [Carnegiea gigantea]
MGFVSCLKVDVKQIPGTFSKWLVKSFDPHVVCFRLLDGQKFPVTAFDVSATLGVPLGRPKIIKITKSLMDEEYDEWTKEYRYYSKSILKYVKDIWDEVREMFISFYDAAIQKSQREAQGFTTKVVKEAFADLQSAHKASNDLCASSFNPALPLDKPDGEAEIPGDTLVSDASIIVEKEEHCEDAVLD